MDLQMNQEISQLISESVVVEVKTKEDLSRITLCIKAVKQLQAKVSESFDPIIDKAYKSHKEGICQRDKYLKPLQDVEKRYKSAILTYTKRLEEEQRELERKTNEELAKMAESRKQEMLTQASELDNEWEAEILKDQAQGIKPATVVVATKIIEQEGLNIRKTWKYRIVNEELIPRLFLMVNDPALNLAAKQESFRVTGVLGVEFYQESTASVRA